MNEQNYGWNKSRPTGECRLDHGCPPSALLDLHLALHLRRWVNADCQIDFLGCGWPIAPKKRSTPIPSAQHLAEYPRKLLPLNFALFELAQHSPFEL